MSTANSDRIEIWFFSAGGTYQTCIYYEGMVYPTPSRWFASRALAVLHVLEKAQVSNPGLTFALLGQLPVVMLP